MSDPSSSEIPLRSAEGQAALDIFYLDFNDVNFYVEDQEQENLYEVILKKFFPDIRISRIFPLGGKPAVLAHAADEANHVITNKKIYLLDKDFDDFLENIIADDRVIYLDWYCLENYLVDENAIVELVVETHPKERRDSVRNALKVGNTVQTSTEALLPLFALFFYVQQFNLGLKNCDSKPEEYCHPKQLWLVRNELIDRYLDLIRQTAQGLGIEPPLDDPSTDARLSHLHGVPPYALVSGKFLLSMLFHYVKSKFALGSISFDSFRFRLAKNCSLSDLEPTVTRIRSSLALQG